MNHPKLTCALLLAVLALVFGVLTLAQGAPATTVPLPQTLTESSVITVAQQRLPSIVFVRNGGTGLTELPRGGSGSGVIIDASALIVTNAHVVLNAASVQVQTADGDELEARVVGTDPISDLALLRISPPRPLRAARLGNSDRLQPGQWVVALGNPVELHHTVTMGIISAVDRTLDADGQEYIQTDASINPGSSGGALFDLRGNLIGITTGMLSAVGEDAGLNFAIPVDVVRDLLPQLERGAVVHGWIGASLTPIASAATGGFHGRPGPATLRVAEVTPGSPADRAGIVRGDVIAGIAGVRLPRARDVRRHLRLSQPGTAISIRIVRDGLTLQVPIVVAENPRGNSRQ